MLATSATDVPVDDAPGGLLSRSIGQSGSHDSRPTSVDVWTALLIVVAAAAAAWLRLPGAVRGTMWAEDARIFSQRALDGDTQVLGIFTPYAGYTHSIPQFLANVIWVVVPSPYVAIAVTATCCILAAGIAAMVYLLTARWELPYLARLSLAALTVLAPTLSNEVLGNLANLHWFFLWAAPFLFLFRPRSWVTATLLALVAFFAVTTEVQMVLFAPLLLLGWRRAKVWPILAATSAGAAVQITSVLLNAFPRGEGSRSIRAIVWNFFLEVPLTALTGSTRASAAVVASSGWTTAFLSLTPFVLCAVIYATGRSWSRRGVSLLFLTAAAVLWTAGFALNYFSVFDYPSFPVNTLAQQIVPLRYAVVPIMLLMALVVFAMSRTGDAPGTRWGVSIPVLVLLASLLASTFHVDESSFRAGPNWRDQIEQAVPSCKSGPTGRFSVDAAPYGWNLEVPCRAVIERD